METSPEDALCVTLLRPHLVHLTTLLPSEEVRLGEKKNKKKHEHSQDIGFKIYSDDREREREKMDLSSFLVPPHLFESILALDNDGIYQLIICWHCSCVYCLSHQPPSMGLQAPQCVLGCSTETYKRMGWEERLKP